jgi:hypothetical protein
MDQITRWAGEKVRLHLGDSRVWSALAVRGNDAATKNRTARITRTIIGDWIGLTLDITVA